MREKKKGLGGNERKFVQMINDFQPPEKESEDGQTGSEVQISLFYAIKMLRSGWIAKERRKRVLMRRFGFSPQIEL